MTLLTAKCDMKCNTRNCKEILQSVMPQKQSRFDLRKFLKGCAICNIFFIEDKLRCQKKNTNEIKRKQKNVKGINLYLL